ncbi:MAG: hypothetical protein NUW37_13225 [Planctomycetes bacterium]|nr:hypothetical protein [Planctomycetota bacterium]
MPETSIDEHRDLRTWKHDVDRDPLDGELVPEDTYEDYKKEVPPTAEDKKELKAILAGYDRMEPRN